MRFFLDAYLFFRVECRLVQTKERTKAQTIGKLLRKLRPAPPLDQLVNFLQERRPMRAPTIIETGIKPYSPLPPDGEMDGESDF
jgi:hypothetical protein